MPTTWLPPLPASVTAETQPLRFRPLDIAAFVRELAGDAAELTTHATQSGWPFHVAACSDRFIAVYEFLDHVGVVTIRGARADVTAVLAQARPDWRGPDVIALSQLWEDD